MSGANGSSRAKPVPLDGGRRGLGPPLECIGLVMFFVCWLDEGKIRPYLVKGRV